MVRGEIIQSDVHGRIRVSEVLCVGRNGVNIDNVISNGIEAGYMARQFVVLGFYQPMRREESCSREKQFRKIMVFFQYYSC